MFRQSSVPRKQVEPFPSRYWEAINGLQHSRTRFEYWIECVPNVSPLESRFIKWVI